MNFFYFFFICFALNTFAQNQSNIWYFGYSAGLDFNSGSPIPINGGQINAYEGCAVQNDKTTGLLVFYTDGITVWDKNHLPMTNGTGLFGDNYSSASALIVPKPGSVSLYYIFTASGVSGTTPTTLSYSIVDITLNGNLGDVTIKNQLVLDSCCEKLSAVFKDCSGSEIWVLSHKLNSDEFYSYLITSSGVGVPVISPVGSVHTQGKGYMKISPNGKKVGLASNADGTGGGIVELFDFNVSTGIVSNPISLPPDNCNYGVSFSPDNSKLYVTGYESCGNEELYQYDVSSGIAATIIASKTLIAGDLYFGALQNAPDGKMYVALDFNGGLGVINNPNSSGTACNYVSGSLLLGGMSSHGLPYFIESYFNQNSFLNLGNDLTTCISTPYALDAGAGWTSYLWSTGDSTQTINAGTSGTYWVNASDTSGCSATDTITITFNAPFLVNLGNDTTICFPTTVLNANVPNTTYLWSTGSTLQNITVNSNGAYWVKVGSGSCSAADSINLTFSSINVNLGNDVSVCDGPVPINAGTASSYIWSTGASTQSITAASSGTYYVQVSNGTCTDNDSIDIIINSFSLDLGPDISGCPSATVLDAGNGGASWLWSTGNTTQSIVTDTSGIYFVVVSGGACTHSDTIKIQFEPITDTLVPCNVFTPNGDGKNDEFYIGAFHYNRFNLKIYNRWGILVYETNDLAKYWNGKHKDKDADESVYYWIAEYEPLCKPGNQVLIKKGTITLLR